MPVATGRACAHDGCENPIPAGSRADRRYCADACTTAAYADRQRRARLRLMHEQPRVQPTGVPEPPVIDRLRAAVKDAVQEEKLLAVIAAEARHNWRASAWLRPLPHPTRWGERGHDVQLAFNDDPDDPYAEVDQLAERRRKRQRPDGY